MARLEWVHMRLMNWSRWVLTRGSGKLGYAKVNLLDPNASRSGYVEAPIPVNAVEASETDAAIGKLPSELKATVLQYYVGKGTEADHLRRLCCSRSTLYARIERAQRLLSEHFAAQQDKRRHERDRVEALQEGFTH